MMAAQAEPLVLRGDAFARGRAQAALCPDSVAAVNAFVHARLQATAELSSQPHIARYLDAQWDFASTHDPDGMAELAGIASGYGLDPRALFAFMHAGQLSGLPDDGCSAWAWVHPVEGATVVKNRDLRGPALPLQRVFCHHDSAWRGRSVLCVGSLGAPGAYSSGVNSDGLALVDTQVVTTDQGIGMLRYFMMTRLLANCASVSEAVETLHATHHAGGGTLILGDAAGEIAVVELGHTGIWVRQTRAGWLARTNHFLASPLANRLLAAGDDSHARLVMLTSWLGVQEAVPSVDQAAAVMATHDAAEGVGLCRHGQGGGSTTISCSIFACRSGTLYFANGNPCAGAWVQMECVGSKAGDERRDGPGR